MARMLLLNESNDATSEEPASLTEAIVDLYLSVKIRKDDEELDESILIEEKENLQSADPFVVLEYIRNSFDILLNMRMEEKKEKWVSLKGSRNSNDQSAKTAIETQFQSEADNNDYE